MDVKCSFTSKLTLNEYEVLVLMECLRLTVEHLEILPEYLRETEPRPNRAPVYISGMEKQLYLDFIYELVDKVPDAYTDEYEDKPDEEEEDEGLNAPGAPDDESIRHSRLKAKFFLNVKELCEKDSSTFGGVVEGEV